MNGNEKFLNHLRFADDIGVGLDQAQTTLEQLNKESNKANLKMNLSKTKARTKITKYSDIKIGNTIQERGSLIISILVTS